jgi:hypothetical protein
MHSMVDLPHSKVNSLIHETPILQYGRILTLGFRSSPYRSVARFLQKRDDMRIDLTDDEMIDIKEFREFCHGQVVFNGPVDPSLRRGVPGLRLTCPGIFRHDFGCGEDEGDGTGCGDGAPNQDVGGGQVIQEAG